MGTADKILVAVGLFSTIPAILLVIYAFIHGRFPPIIITKTNVYRDDTPKNPDIEFRECDPGPVTPIIISSTNTTEDNRPGASAAKNPPFTKDEEEPVDPLAGLLGETHALFSGGDRVGN